MIGIGEFSRALTGAWRLARLDPGGMLDFNSTISGFWRSFWAAVILSPAFLWMSATEFANLSPPVEATRFMAANMIAYVVGWTAFPLAMYHVARWIGREDRYVGYIVAYNWSAIIRVLVVLPTQILAMHSPDSAWMWEMPSVLASAWILFYAGYIARVALDISIPQAIAIVLGDVVLTMMIVQIETGIIFPP